ncbi:MAG: pyridoxamine 5'-phosphate oxidase family protein [Chitinophagaceae bacterium]
MDIAQHQKEVVKFRDLINKIKLAALVTHSADGLKGRPMQTVDVDLQGNLWFFTNDFTEKVEEIAQESEVFLSYTNLADNAYVMVNGTGRLVHDKAKIESLWNPALKAWFPDGLDDPRIMLLEVIPDEVEYWNGSSNKLVVAFKMLRAIIKGEQYEDGDHKKIALH